MFGWLASYFAPAKPTMRRLRESDDWFSALDYYQTMLARFGDLTDGYVPVSSQGERQDGQLYPAFFSEQELGTYRSMARWICTQNPFAVAILRALENFVVGCGITYTAEATDAAYESVAEEAQAVIDEFLKRHWSRREREFYRRAVRDGEVFVRLFPQSDGTMTTRFIEPEQITPTPGAGNNARFGIETDPDDIETVLAYHAIYSTTHERIDAAEVLHYKRNVDAAIKRGLSDFHPVTDDLREIDELLAGMRQGANVQARIALIRQHEAASAEQVDTFRTGVREGTQPNPPGTRTINRERMPRGAIVDIPKGLEFVPPPSAGNGPAFIAIEQASLRGVAVRWSMPEYVVSADASNNNFASILVAGSPFVMNVEADQRDVALAFGRIIDAVLTHAAESGRLPANVLDLISVEIKGKTPIVANKLETAQVRQIERQNGVLSPQTWRSAEGYDNDIEDRNLDEWEARRGPDLSMQTPLPGRPMESRLATVQVNLPKVRQHTDYSCGAAATQAVAEYFGVGPSDEAWYRERLGTDPTAGTAPEQIVRLIQELGLQVDAAENRTVDEIKAATDAGSPVMVLIQAYGDSQEYAATKAGHYVVVIGYDNAGFTLEDPSQETTRGFMSFGDFDSRWYDETQDGKRLTRWGAIVSKAQQANEVP